MKSRPTPLIYKINKPKGESSFSVISSLKREFPKSKTLKIGHFGTLDPFAEGLLLVGINGATRLNQYIQKAFPKTYIARGIFGQKTTTGDLEGDMVLNSSAEMLKDYGLIDLKKLLESRFKGEYHQAPPSFSAAKFKGKRLYKYALEGTIISKEPVLRIIYDLEILSFDFPFITFSATVSSGTYIRSLFEDMAQALGTVGHLLHLKRTAIGSHGLLDSINPGDFKEKKDKGMTLDTVFPLSQVNLNKENSIKFCHGNNVNLEIKMGSLGGILWVYNEENFLIGMGQIKEGGFYPVWVFA